MVVEGEAGIGKTELLRAVAEIFEGDGIMVFRARGGRLERDFGFGVVRQLFEPILAGIPLRARKSLFAGAAALAAPVVGFEQPEIERSVPDPVFAAQHGLYWLAVNLASLRSIALLVDDVHWADAASLRWFLYLVRRLEQVPLSLVLASRAGEPGPHADVMGALRAEPLVDVISLSGLSQEATSRLLRDRLPAADEDFCAACHRVTGGNPFLAAELAAAVASESWEPTAQNSARVAELGPPTVARSVLLRLGRLTGDAQSLARAVAVLDTDADARYAMELAGLDGDRLAVSAASLVETRIFENSESLRFAHPILRAAVYADLPAPARSAQHRRAARALLALDGDPDRAAVHLLVTTPTGEAWVAHELAEAAERAVGRGAPDAAVVLLARALAEPPAPEERPVISLNRGVAAFMSAHPDTEALLREAIAEGDSPPARADAAMVLSQLEVGAGRVDEALTTLGQAITDLGVGDVERSGRLELYRAVTMAVRGDRWEGVQQSLEALRDRAEPGSWVRGVAAGCLIWQESLRPAGARPELVAMLRSELGDPAMLAQGTGPLDFVYFNWAMMGLEQVDDVAGARAGFDAAARIAQQSGHLAGLAPVLAARAPVLFALGELRAAEADAHQAIQVGPSVGNNVARDWGLATLCMVLADRGAFDAAEQVLAAQGLQSGDPGATALEARLLIGRAYLRSAQGQHRLACADVMRYGARLAGYDGAPFGSLPAICARILAAGGQTSPAHALIARALEVTACAGIDGIRGMVLHAQGLLERGRPAVEHLQEAVRLLEDSPRRLELARALADLGGALRRANQRAEAREPLRRAMELASRCGAEAIAEHARQELIATGARPRRTMRSGREALTASELRVAELAAAGENITEIAQTLFVTRKTVETHLYSAYRKLDVNTRDGLADAMRSDATEVPAARA